MMYSSKTVQTLNRLTEACINGAHGYNLAATMVEAQQYVLLFQTIARQRETFTTTLQDMVTRSGNMPITRETPMLAAAHRAWMKIRATVHSQRPLIVLAECERGDQVALLNYEKALQTQLPSDVQPVVATQYRAIASVYNRIHALHDALRMNLQAASMLPQSQ